MKSSSEVQQYCWDRWTDAERNVTRFQSEEALQASEFWRTMHALFEDRVATETHNQRRDNLATAVTEQFFTFNPPRPELPDDAGR